MKSCFSLFTFFNSYDIIFLFEKGIAGGGIYFMDQKENPGAMDLAESTVTSEEVYSGVLLHVYRDEVLLPNGNQSVREHIRHLGASCVVPLTENGEVLMVRQFRYPFRRVLLEVPAGKLDSAEEDPMDAAKRELREETGATAAEMVYLGPYYPTCAYSNEIIHMYLAKGLSFGSSDPDEDEFIATQKIPLQELIDMVMQGKIADGKTQTALLKAYYYLHENCGE